MSELPISGSYRPTIMGTNGMVSSGHYLATLAGERIPFVPMIVGRYEPEIGSSLMVCPPELRVRVP